MKNIEKKERVYSLHRYVDANGVPDLERIFSEKEKPWMPGHLNPELKNIWRNQPEVVKEKVKEHLRRCDSCRNKFEEPMEQDLPF